MSNWWLGRAQIISQEVYELPTTSFVSASGERGRRGQPLYCRSTQRRSNRLFKIRDTGEAYDSYPHIPGTSREEAAWGRPRSFDVNLADSCVLKASVFEDFVRPAGAVNAPQHLKILVRMRVSKLEECGNWFLLARTRAPGARLRENIASSPRSGMVCSDAVFRGKHLADDEFTRWFWTCWGFFRCQSRGLYRAAASIQFSGGNYKFIVYEVISLFI